MNKKGQVGILVVILVVAFCIFGLGFPLFTQKDVQITVTKTDRIVESNGENVHSKYIVYTETESFENTDSLAFGKFNSSDLQGQLLPGKTYVVKVYGWRIPFLSQYRNIVKIEEKL